MTLGTILLYLAVLSCFANFCWRRYVKLTVFFQFSLLTIALLKLMNAYINTDYELINVLENSHEFVPIVYKIAGVWSNHEGSMLLLVWSFSLITLLFSRYSKFTPDIRAKTLHVQSGVIGGLVIIVLIASNPFLISEELFPTGRGLNPLLQDIGLTIHPPILYLGYAATSIPFSLTLAMLLGASSHKNNLAKIGLWLLAPWALVSAGIGLGSWWAYRELGWGGFWFWDPVENISLVVWLSATVTLHCLKLSKDRVDLYKWLHLSNIATFLLAILAVMLVRSGVLASVHSFAFDARRGQLLFAFFLILMIFSITIFIRKDKEINEIKHGHNYKLLAAILLLVLSYISILLGIIYPFLYKFLFNQEISINETFYTSVLSVLLLPMLYILGIYSAGTKKTILMNLLCAGIIVIVIHCFSNINRPLNIFYMHAAIFILISTLSTCRLTLGRKKTIMFFGHFGFALVILGGALYYSYKFEQTILAKENSLESIRNYQIILKTISYSNTDNYLSRIASVEIRKNGSMVGVLNPEIRFYPVEKTFTTESAILHTYLGDIYLTLGELNQNAILLTFRFEPFIYLIWLGVLFIVSTLLLYMFPHANKIKS